MARCWITIVHYQCKPHVREIATCEHHFYNVVFWNLFPQYQLDLETRWMVNAFKQYFQMKFTWHKASQQEKITMDVFSILRKHLAMCGIVVRKAPLNAHSFTLYNSAIIVLANLYGISIVKLVDEASTFDEYTDILNRTILVELFTISYIDIVCKTPELLRFVDCLEDSIRTSK